MTDLYWMILLVVALVVGNLWLLKRNKQQNDNLKRRRESKK